MDVLAAITHKGAHFGASLMAEPLASLGQSLHVATRDHGLFQSQVRISPSDDSRDEENHQSTDEASDDASVVELGDALTRHQTGQSAADEGACDAESDRHDETHLLIPWHQPTSDESNEKSENDEKYDAHFILLLPLKRALIGKRCELGCPPHQQQAKNEPVGGRVHSP